MKILKFGGTSVGSAERMHHVSKLIKSEHPTIVVLSAMSGTTNALVEIAAAYNSKEEEKAHQLIDQLYVKYNSVIRELYKSNESITKGQLLIDQHFGFLKNFNSDKFTSRDEKAILAEGELLSTHLFQYFLEEIKQDSALIPALDFMRIDENEEPDLKYISENIAITLKKFPNKKLFITQGYICRNSLGEIDNLKRGGSDYTASLIGAAVLAEEVQIWTDIDGMHNNDPRIVDKTFPIAELSFDEAAELAYFGAKILHPSTILPARLKNIPVKLLNTMQPEAKGTIITQKASGSNIKAVAAKDGITAIKIKSSRMLLAYGFLRSVFEVFERHKTPIDMITTSEVAVSLTIDNNKNLDKIAEELKNFGVVEIDKDQSIVCIVGDFSATSQGHASKVFDALKNIPIRMISYGGSENNISILIDGKLKKETLVALNKGVFNL